MPVGEIVFRDPSVPLTPGQADARRRVAKIITDEPGSFDMDWWEKFHDDDDRQEQARWSGQLYACGTTRCIAGWAQFCATGRVNDDTVAQDAVDVLGLTLAEYEPPGMSPLFHATNTEALARMNALAQAAPG